MNEYEITAMVPMRVTLKAENAYDAKLKFDKWTAQGVITRGQPNLDGFDVRLVKITGPGCDAETYRALLPPKDDKPTPPAPVAA